MSPRSEFCRWNHSIPQFARQNPLQQNTFGRVSKCELFILTPKNSSGVAVISCGLISSAFLRFNNDINTDGFYFPRPSFRNFIHRRTFARRIRRAINVSKSNSTGPRRTTWLIFVPSARISATATRRMFALGGSILVHSCRSPATIRSQRNKQPSFDFITKNDLYREITITLRCSDKCEFSSGVKNILTGSRHTSCGRHVFRISTFTGTNAWLYWHIATESFGVIPRCTSTHVATPRSALTFSCDRRKNVFV